MVQPQFTSITDLQNTCFALKGPCPFDHVMMLQHHALQFNLAPHIHFARGQFRPHPQQTVPTQQNVTWHPSKPHKKLKNRNKYQIYQYNTNIPYQNNSKIYPKKNAK